MKPPIKFSQTRGFAILGILIAMVLLGSMAAGIAALVPANSRLRAAQIYSRQAFYVAHGAMEYALRQRKEMHVCNPPTRQFMGTPLGLTNGTKIASSVTYGNTPLIASDSYSIAPPAGGHPTCISVLGTSGTSVSVAGSGSFDMSGCGLNLNSTSSSALKLTGSATLNVGTANIVGSYSTGGSSQVVGTVNTGTTATTDPLSSVPAMPSYSACDYDNFSISGSGSTTINPGVYCNGIQYSGTGPLTLNPGNYIIDGGTLKITGSGNISGSDVTIFLNSQIKSGYANLDIAGSGTITLAAPTSGTYAGITIYQSRNAPSGSNKITGSAGADITGAIYLPNQSLDFRGSSSTNGACTMLVVNAVSFSGSSNVDCAAGDLSGLVSAGSGCT